MRSYRTAKLTICWLWSRPAGPTGPEKGTEDRPGNLRVRPRAQLDARSKVWLARPAWGARVHGSGLVSEPIQHVVATGHTCEPPWAQDIDA